LKFIPRFRRIPRRSSKGAVGDCRSELGKLLVAGFVKAFYARAKLAKEAKRDRSGTTVLQRKET
jgi:hypothetical protein